MKSRNAAPLALALGYALALTGCSTEPSGGKLPPPPPPVSDEQYREQANKQMSDMYAKMGKAPGGVPAAPKGGK